MSAHRAGKRAYRVARQELPLVSCIMPTANRRRFVPEAIRLFLAQDYPAKELVVVDDGEDNVADLIQNDPQIRYLCLDHRHSLGTKRNVACEAARGEIIAHWDDDDWYAPWRLSRQVGKIIYGEVDLCGLARMLFFDPTAQRAWEYVYPAGAAPWVYGATFCYRKSIWQQSPFPDNTGCEDNLFIANLPASVRLRALPEPGIFVGLVHRANISPKHTQDPLWRPQPIARIRGVVRGNWAQAPRRAVGPGVGSKPVPAVSTSFGAAVVVASVLSGAVGPASANPKGGQVSAGSATITQTGPTQLNIIQSTDRAAIDWQSFSIAPGEQTNFQQPVASSVTLNRVQPGDPSVIAGKLTANGQVVLINPSGITFSKGAVVDVNSLVATPTDISNSNFMAGQMKFDKPSTDPRASVVNQGTITVAQKGLAALVAPAVKNSGTIEAKLGKVVLGGAQTYTVDFYGDGLISFDVGPKVTAVPTRPDGQPVKSLVSNTGRIDAPGGTVLLTADAAAGIVENVVDVHGRITARTSGQTPGSVTIDAGPGGAAKVSGRIDVSGLKPGQTGGSATVTGGSVNLASTARIDARGNAGGGTVKIGGGPHGQDVTVRNAQTTTVAAAAVIDASATGSGNGGQVTVWSDQTTTFAGTIKARGGTSGGDGGWVETSGKGSLSVAPTAVIDASAPEGKPGEWLLDPPTLTVDVCAPACGPTEVDATAISTTLDTGLNGTNVTLTTTGSPGTITINALNNLTEPPAAVPVSWSTPAQLSLNAAGSISILTPITGTNTGSTLVLQAGTTPGLGGSISQSAAIMVGTLTGSSTGGTFLDFPGVANNIANLGPFTDSSLFGISLTNAQPLTVTGPVNTGSTGSINLTTTGAGSDMTLAAGLTAPTVILSSAGAITQTVGTITAGNLEVEATGQVALGGPNAVGLLSATISGAANGFLFRNDQRDLTIQSVPGDGTGFAGLTTNGGSIEVVTTGTSTSGFNLTIANNPPLGTVVSSGGGPITLMAGGHGGTFTNGGAIASGGLTTSGNIVILADAMTLSAGSINAGGSGTSGSVVLGPVASTNSVALGTSSAGALSLLPADLASISAGMLQIGYLNTDGTPSFTGNINIASPIAINTTQIPSLLLVTGGSVTESSGAKITALPSTMPPLPAPPLSLGVIAGGSVAMTQANQAAVLAGFDDGGAANSFVYRNDGAPLTIGPLTAPTIGVVFDPVTGIPSPSAITSGPLAGPLAGVSTTGAAVTVATTGGANLTVANSSVVSDGGAITLMVGGTGATFTNDDVVASTGVSPALAGNIAIIANNQTLAPGAIIAATPGASGTVLLGPFTATDGIALGTSGSPGVLGLTTADLASIRAGLLQVGYRNVNGTPSVTGNIDIAAPITVDTTKLAGLSLVTGGGVTEAPGATINSTAGPPLALGVIAGSSVSLGQANQVGIVAGFVDGAASNSFLYRNDDASLTVGTLPGSTIGLTFDATTGIPSSANMSGPSTNPLAGVTTAGGNILLETTTSGNLALNQLVTAGSGVVGLSSAGTITQAPPIVAASLGILSADRVSLGAFGGPNDPNQVGILAGQVLNAGESFVFRNDSTNLTIGTVDVVDSFGARLLNPVNGAPLTGPLSGVVTNNGNIGLRVTTSGNLNLAANVDAGNAAVGLESAGTIQQTAGAVTGSALEVSAVGPVSLLATNAVPVLASQTTGAGGSSSFQYRNDAVGLTVATVPTLLESGTGTPPNDQILSVAGLSGVTTAGASILLETTTSGNLVLNQAVNAGTSSVTLTSAGTITEPAGGLITTAALTGSSVGGASLTQGNLVGTLGPFSNMTSGLLSFTNAQPLTTAGVVSSAGGLTLTTTGAGSNLTVGGGLTASGQTVTLSSAGTITEPAGGSITAATLNGTSVGNASLDQGNLLSDLGPFTTSASGAFTLTDSQALTVSGPLSTDGDLRIKVNTGDLTLVGNITAGGGSSNAALVAMAGNASELDDPVVTASGLIIDAAGNVSFGVNSGKVFPANANAVGTLAGTAGGSFGFLNGPALTVGTVPATGGVASQSGISASATPAGDVLIQTNNLGQPLTLAGNIIAGGRAILDTAGGFSQSGAATVTTPVLAIDTTGSGIGTLLGFITSTNVNAKAIAGLPPAGKTSNPIQFANLSAPNSVVLLFADQGAVAGTIQAGQLGLSGIGSLANLRGSISGVSDPTAALLGVRDPEPALTYLFNDCVIAATTCFVPSAATPLGFLVVQPQSPSAVTASDLLPDVAATADFITPEAVRALRQSPDPDAPVINIFDEEHLCDETAQGSQPGRERCQEQR
jgi:filamentous hemagglutinin family protein